MKQTFSLLCILAIAGCTGMPRSSGGTLLPALDGRTKATANDAKVVVDAAKRGPAIVPDVVGANLETWFDESQPHVWRSFASTGLHLTRWPGGSESDTYHWKTNSVCAAGGGYAFQQAQYDNFMRTVVRPAKLDVAITVNYGSNAACSGGGDPSEAAAWVAESKAHHYPVVAWTVGNEAFGSWEFDLHPTPHDPATYANAVTTGYYPAMKKADPNARVGVIAAGGYSSSWDQYVLAHAKHDFVELHYYPQSPGSESDAYLLGSGVSDFATALANLRAEMTAAGDAPSVPIMVGEINSVYANPGKQTVSIVNGLWTGMVVAEMMRAGVPLATWWAAYPVCSTGNNNSPSLYGWQAFGSYNLFSDGPPASQDCNSGMGAGTPYPSGRAYGLLSRFVGKGGTMLAATSKNDAVRAYADQTGGGYDVMLFNLSESATQTAHVSLQRAGKKRWHATQYTYGKAEYDLTRHKVYKGAVASALGTVGPAFDATLPPWSMSVIELR
ncbi:MAG TPA: hypothetical protein VK760_08315 [Candidatus Acidoferrales bacterium]|jgi:hypothetical protein|nr:hypothetical protein [Candidatus Acidoferrales bacterium]